MIQFLLLPSEISKFFHFSLEVYKIPQARTSIDDFVNSGLGGLTLFLGVILLGSILWNNMAIQLIQ